MPKLVNLNADYLLATILSDITSVPFSCLGRLQREIEMVYPTAVVDISTPAIHSALNYYPGIFEWHGAEIRRAPTAVQYLQSEYFEQEFTGSVPTEVHEAVKRAIETVIRELR